MKKNFKPEKPRISEVEIRAMTDAGMGFEQIAKEKGLSAYSLRIAASVLGIQSGRRAGQNVAGWFEQIKQGKTASEIAREIGVGARNVSGLLRYYGYPTTPAKYIKSLQSTNTQEAA